MVKVTIRIRPKSGYDSPRTIQTIDIESSQRLETLLERSEEGNTSAAASSHAALFQNGIELPLNSSVASQNFRNGAILESCASPLLSSACSAVLRDLSCISQKVENVADRGYATLCSLLEVPHELLHSRDNVDFWKSDQWTNPKIEKRKICLATMKKIIQRDDRYSVYNLPACSDLESLHRHLHPVWMETGKRQSQQCSNTSGGNHHQHQHDGDKLPNNSLGYLFSPKTKKNGKPSIIWTLLQQKLRRQMEIAADFYDFGTGADAIEAFVQQDYLRHHDQLPSKPGERRRRKKNNSGLVNTTSTSANSTTTSRDNTGSLPPTPIRQNKVYCPEFASGPFSILSALIEAMLEPDVNKRQLSLTETNLKRMAQPNCKSNFYDRAQGRGARNAFACMEGLAERGLVRKERIGVPVFEKWGLLLEGEKMAMDCLQFERAVKKNVMKSDQFQVNGNSVSIVMDSREDVQFRERLKWHCEDENVVFQEKELPSGDYLFLTQEEEVFPIIIERKTWSDLADSVTGKGRGRRRLDCVKIGSRSGECERRKCQLCKMKKSGLKQRIFFIEGGRCHGKDGVRSKCTMQKRCQPCKQLMERHGPEVIQESLEEVLNKLQIEHGCHIHFTRSYNETIESLITIRNLIEEGEIFASLKPVEDTAISLQIADHQSTISYQHFCFNVRSSEAQLYLTDRIKGDVNDWTALHLANIISQEPTDWGKELCTELYGITPVEPPLLESTPRQFDPSKNLQHCIESKSNEVIDLCESQNSFEINESQDSVMILDESQDPVVIVDESQASVVILDESQDSNDKLTDSSSTDDSSVVYLDDAVSAHKDRSMSKLNKSQSTTHSVQDKIKLPNSVLQTCPLLILHRWGEYDKDFHDKFNAVWQDLYRRMRNRVAVATDDFYAEADLKLSQLVGNDGFPFIPRRTMLYVGLWLQIKLGIQVRIVTRNSQADRIRNLWSQKEHHSSTRMPSTSAKSGSTQTDRCKRKLDVLSHSPINPSNDQSSIDETPKKARRALHSETSVAIEARLRRFQKKAVTSKIPPSTARIQNDFIDANEKSGWTCSKCTLQNSHHVEVCHACQERKNPQKLKPSSHFPLETSEETKKTTRTCPQCTFENNYEAVLCSMCNTSIETQSNVPKSHMYTPLDSTRSSYDVGMVSETSQKQKGSTWDCSNCTFENNASDFMCSMCDKPKYVAQRIPSSNSHLSSSFVDSPLQKLYAAQSSKSYSSSNSCDATRRSKYLVSSLDEASSLSTSYAGQSPCRPAVTSSTPSKVSGVTCGACGLSGHNRRSATEYNCPKYFDDAEVELRRKKERKAREKAEKERDELDQLKAEAQMTSEQGEQRLKEMQRIVAEQENSLQGHQKLQKEDIKRREKRLKNARRRAGLL